MVRVKKQVSRKKTSVVSSSSALSSAASSPSSGYRSTASSLSSRNSPSQNLRPRPTKAPERLVYQPSIPQTRFSRIVRALAEEMTGRQIKFEKEALKMIKEESERMLVRLFDRMGHCAFVNGRKTVTLKDLMVVQYRSNI